jgi:hypothetical protein
MLELLDEAKEQRQSDFGPDGCNMGIHDGAAADLS